MPPRPLSTQQLQQYRDFVSAGGVAEAGKVYADLYSKGYKYAGWAEGVAKKNSIAGLLALNYLKEAHLADKGELLTKEQSDKLVKDMALRTLDEYINISKKEGKLTRDLNFAETEAVHKDGYEANNFNLNGWTLNAPMQILRNRGNEKSVEELWTVMRDTGGKGLDALMLNTRVATFMLGVSCSKNEQERQLATEWLKNVNPTPVDVTCKGVSLSEPPAIKTLPLPENPDKPLPLDHATFSEFLGTPNIDQFLGSPKSVDYSSLPTLDEYRSQAKDNELNADHVDSPLVRQLKQEAEDRRNVTDSPSPSP